MVFEDDTVVVLPVWYSTNNVFVVLYVMEDNDEYVKFSDLQYLDSFL